MNMQLHINHHYLPAKWLASSPIESKKFCTKAWRSPAPLLDASRDGSLGGYGVRFSRKKGFHQL